MTRLFTFVSLVVVLHTSSAVFTQDQERRIETFINELLVCRNVPGFTVAVVKGDETWTKGFGMSDLDNETAVNEDTLFGIGSLTKAFTTTLLAILLGESNGKYTWTTKVRDFLGKDFAFIDDVRTKELTLRDLLTHRTGLHPAMIALLAGYDSNFTRADFAKRFKYLPAVKEFRDEYDYNNVAYALAGHIAEVLSGESYEEALRKKIFDPLGMTRARVLGKTINIDEDDIAKPYAFSRGRFELTDPSIYVIFPAESAGAIALSATDMTKWLQFHLRQGKTSDSRSLANYKLLKEVYSAHESISQRMMDMISINKPLYPASDVSMSYGYGWNVGMYEGYRRVSHGGQIVMFTAYNQIFPDLGVAVFTGANTGGPSAMQTHRTAQFFITDLLLGREPWITSTTACSFPSPWVTPPASSQDNSKITNAPIQCLECYVGRYGHRFFGDIYVKATDGTLELRYHRLRGTLNATDVKTAFELDVWEPYRLINRPGNNTQFMPVTFSNIKNGKYNTIELYAPKMSFSRDVTFYGKPKEPETNAQDTNKRSMVVIFCAVFIWFGSTYHR